MKILNLFNALLCSIGAALQLNQNDLGGALMLLNGACGWVLLFLKDQE